MKFRTPILFLFFVAVSIISVQLFFNSENEDVPIAINIWYGKTQFFGNNGSPQRQLNILGNISGSVDKFSYSLNGGENHNLSIGPQKPLEVRRLYNLGDFATEIFQDNPNILLGSNQVIFEAVDYSQNTLLDTVLLNYSREDAKYPISIHWTEIDTLQKAIQVIDGYWKITDRGIRSDKLHIGYDRCFAVGDTTLSNYEIRTTVRVNAFYPKDSYPSFGAGFGILTGWRGHTNNDTPGLRTQILQLLYPEDWQPYVGFTPYDGLFLVTPDDDNFSLNFSRNDYDLSYEEKVNFNTSETYSIIVQCENLNENNREYSFKIWKSDGKEPKKWNFKKVYEREHIKKNGSILFIAHHADMTYGDITINSLE